MTDIIGGALTLALTIGALIAAYHAYMICIYRDIAREDAEEEADRLFNSYVRNCEYRVITQLKIVDEMGRNT